MSRVNAGAPILVRPQNNIYTALAGAATLAVLAACIVVFMKTQEIGDPFKLW